MPYNVPQEIHYLSKLTDIACSQFRHILITGDLLDPIDLANPEDVREAHLFTAEGSDAHKAFDQAARGVGGIVRKWDCKPEAGRPAGLCYLAMSEKTSAFEELAAGLNIPMAWGVLTDPKALINYNAPQNICWIVTYIFVRSYNPDNYLALGTAEPGSQIGDMRSDDFDWNGYTNAWINVRTTPVFGQNIIPTFGLFNKPVLFAFQGGNRVRLFVQRNANSLPADPFKVQVCMHGYLAPMEAYTKLADNVTKVENQTAGS